MGCERLAPPQPEAGMGGGTRVRVLADSVGPHGRRVTTVEARFPRIILSQVRTYGMLSFSVRSSRAVPVKALVEEVKADPYIPAEWRKAQKGMVAGEVLTGDEAEQCRLTWLSARDEAVCRAERLLSFGVAKEHANRLLEPFAWAWAVVTGTADEWAWLFHQRTADDAQPEFRTLAVLTRDAMRASQPRTLRVGEWHVPYPVEADACLTPDERLMASARRCARVSYAPFDGTTADPVTDARKAADLAAAGHWSPFEHQSMCCATPAYRSKLAGWMSQRHRLGH